MDKENVVNSYVTLDWNIKYGTFLSLKKKKKLNPAMCDNMDEPGGYCAK